MRFRFVVIPCMITFLASCDTGVPAPDYKLTDAQLTSLLNDLYFSEALLMSQTGVKRDSIRTLFWQRMTEVYNMDEAGLRAEVEKLKLDQAKLKMIFDQVKTEVDSLQ